MSRPHHKQMTWESRIQTLNLIHQRKEFDNLRKIITVKISGIFISWTYFEFLMAFKGKLKLSCIKYSSLYA